MDPFLAQKVDPESGLLFSKGATDSIMSGLNCGLPSTTAWPVLRDLADGYVAFGDAYAKDAVRMLAPKDGDSDKQGWGISILEVHI